MAPRGLVLLLSELQRKMKEEMILGKEKDK
jgi:hypothetical protein